MGGKCRAIKCFKTVKVVLGVHLGYCESHLSLDVDDSRGGSTPRLACISEAFATVGS